MSFITAEARNYYKSFGFQVLRPGENAKDEDKLVSKGLAIPNRGIISMSDASCYQPVTANQLCYILRAIKPVKSRKRIVYKVVKSGSLTSARTWGNLEVTYKIGKITKAPKGTRLFTFEKLEDAKNFQDDDESIFECEVTDGIVGYGTYSCGFQEAFWKEFNGLNKSRHPEKAIKKVNELISKTEYKALLVTKLKLLQEVR